jgi:hypothetical protein
MMAACAPGLIYTDVTVPLTKNVEQTPIGTKLATNSTQHVRIPLPRGRLAAEWDSRAIGETAKKRGLEEVYYADLRILSILAGTWKRETIRVWGK